VLRFTLESIWLEMHLISNNSNLVLCHNLSNILHLMLKFQYISWAI